MLDNKPMKEVVIRIKQWFKNNKTRQKCKKEWKRIGPKGKIALYSNSPRNNPERYAQDVYLLHEKVIDPDVYNIGIIGSFGSGKSSFLKTYHNQFWHTCYVFSDYKDKYYSTISLANFEDPAEIKEQKNNSEEARGEKQITQEEYDETIGNQNESGNTQIHDINFSLEKSILEQLLFKVPKNKVPSSRISRIKQNFWPSLFLSVFITMAVASVLMGLMDVFNIYRFGNESHFPIYFYVAMGSILIAFILIFYNMRINKVSVNNLEIELAKQSQESVLNLFIDEIIYYFKRTKTKVVVFEDIERFKEVGIFSKLRELNTLINNSQQIKQKVTFIYAINEDILKKKEDRAKFFDFILTVPPLVDASNAAEIIKKLIGPNEKLEKAIDDFSLYLTDIRIINNTINDYNILKSKLKNDKYTDENATVSIYDEKIFAFAAYKNICPRDYQLFRYNNGILRNVLVDKRKEKINLIIKKQNETIEEIDNSLLSLNEMRTRNLENAKMLVVGYLIIKGSSTNNINVENTHKNVQTISAFDDSLNLLFVLCSSVRDIYGRENRYYKTATKETIFSFFNVKSWEEFNTRFVEPDKERERLISRKKQTLNEIAHIKKEPLSSLIRKYNQYFDFGNKPESKFIEFLLVNGYIDETYPIYFPNNGNGFLSENDQVFINNVLTSTSSDYGLKLSNIYAVSKRIQEEKFFDKYILNFYLLEYIFDNYKDNENKCNNVLNFLSSNNDESVKFFVSYFNNNFFNERLISKIIKQNNDLLSIFLLSESLDEQTKKECAILMFEHYFDFKDVLSNKHDLIKSFLEENHRTENILKTINRSAINTFVEFLIEQNIKIKDINQIETIDQNVLDTIIHSSNYEINLINLRYLLDKYYSSGCVLNICNIKKIRDETILNYTSNVKQLLTVFINESEMKFEEDDKVLEEIFNNNEIDDNTKINYLNLLTNRINFIDTITENVYKSVLSTNKLSPSWGNVTSLIKKYPNIKEDLEKYLNNQDNEEIYQEECELNDIVPFSSNYEIVKKLLEQNDKVLEKAEELKLSAETVDNLLSHFNLNKNSKEQFDNKNIFNRLLSGYEPMVSDFNVSTLEIIADYAIKNAATLKDNSVNIIFSKTTKQKIEFATKYLTQLNNDSFTRYIETVLGKDFYLVNKIEKEEYEKNKAVYDEIQKRGIKTIKVKNKYCYLT